MKIGILYGGISPEREVSLSTGKAIAEAIHRVHEVELVRYDGDISSLLDKLSSFNIVFNALHGGDGENGEIQKTLDEHNIKYTGSGPEASRLAMDKSATKKIAMNRKIPTPMWMDVYLENDNIPDDFELAFPYPAVVKPNDGGSTFGLSLIDESHKLIPALELAGRYSSHIILEEFIPGREITVGILKDRAFPIVEIIPTHDVFDYECKYQRGMSRYICPADISPSVTEKIQDAAMDIFTALGCRHYARVDFRLKTDDRFYLLEVNTLPGFTETSLLPKSAEKAGLSYKELIESIINTALGAE